MDRILKEGIENRFIRHIETGEFTINWANHFFQTLSAPGFESLTVTCLAQTRKINVANLYQELSERGMIISNGYGDLKDKTFRIAHMGELTIDDMMEVTSAIEDILKLN